ncbi:MAG: tRNA (cytidine(34)-2'-O)-methyltransferase [Corynebacterium sp.]|nr:tRNA (cytidine(34)-2'-O)-methyltransferase [Corynebacterium sp.]
MAPFTHIIFDQPCIPPNTGNAIRLCANTGAKLHLAGPLGFNLKDKNLKRAGLDYHDFASVAVHKNLQACLDALPTGRVFAFSSHGTVTHTNISYELGDILLFGPEPTGLDAAALQHPRVTEIVRIPMRPGIRSLNLANAASVAMYEAWRQLGYPGAELPS